MKPIQVILKPLKEIPKVRNKKEEYIKCGFDKKDYLPIVFRVKLRGSSRNGILGVSKFHYGYVYLDSIYDIFHRDYKTFGLRVLRTYIHEFLHCYFFTKLTKEDMQGYKIRSISWGWNEYLIEKLVDRIIKCLDLNGFIAGWCEMFKDLGGIINEQEKAIV